MTIAATVITKNEAPLIRTCLDSLSWVDEMIVVDSGSTDGTYYKYPKLMLMVEKK